MRLERLLTMGPAELACRSRQQMSKTVDRLAISAKPGRRQRISSVIEYLQHDESCREIYEAYQQGEPGDAADAFLRHFQLHAASRFFPGATDDKVASILIKHCVEAHHEIVEGAESVCQGKFDILGYGRLSFGEPVDWHYDPVAKRHAPREHWTRIDPLDNTRVGDSKVIWELNRHQWLLEIGQAYRITGDEYYARCFAGLIRDWMQKNPPGIGINWSSSLELSMRIISWCWALVLFRDAKAMSSALFTEMVSWIRVFANYIERYLSYYFSPNTHLTGEALGLFYAGKLFPEIQEAPRWTALGESILEQQLQYQVHPDGVYFEQSTRYQYYTVEIYLHYLILSGGQNPDIKPAIKERLNDMLDFLLAMRRPDGTVPQVGDNDGGWLLPLLRRNPEDYSALFSLAAVLLNRPDCAWAAKDITAELLWMLGTDGMKALNKSGAMQPEDSDMRAFPSGGYVVMRSDWEDDAHHLVLDTGPLGCSVSGGHGHADLLSIQCTAYGVPYIVDPGTCCYTADSKWRNYFRSTRAHSTIMIDGRDQAQPGKAFSWASRRPEAKLLNRRMSPLYEQVEASHNAYGNEEHPVIHKRRVMFVKHRYWVIVDDLSGSLDHHIELGFQFAKLEAKAESGWVRVCGTNNSCLLVRAFSSLPLNAELVSGGLNPMRGWLSPNYGQRIPAPSLTYSTDADLPLRIVTLLVPMADVSAEIPEVTFFEDENISSLIMNSEVDKELDADIRVDDLGITMSCEPAIIEPVIASQPELSHVRC